MTSGQIEREAQETSLSETVILSEDPRWQLIERIAESESFQKSSRLPALIRYLARCTITGDRHGLSEQSIGRAVLNKRQDYTPTEDSSVRVYVRQLRLRLREFYQAEAHREAMVVDIPKGGYALAFTPVPLTAVVDTSRLAPASTPGRVPKFDFMPVLISGLVLALVVCAAGWIFTGMHKSRPDVPWPLNRLISEHTSTTLVLADVGYSLRLLGEEQVPLDKYIDHTYLNKLIPEHMDKGEARLLHYLAASRITSIADADAAAVISTLAASQSRNLVIRSARDLNPSDLTRGNLIFIGARTSNPWVELYDESLDFQIVEDLAAGTRYIRNRHPKVGEQATYAVPDSTGTSGEDYAILALVPNRSGDGNVLLLQGLRLEGTEAAIKLLQSEDSRAELQKVLTSANAGVTPSYFQALIHARSVAGAPISFDFVSTRPFKK